MAFSRPHFCWYSRVYPISLTAFRTKAVISSSLKSASLAISPPSVTIWSLTITSTAKRVFGSRSM